MNSKTTLILLLCVLFVGAYIVLFEYEGETTVEKESRIRHALQFKVDDISSVRIEAEDLQIECEKTSEGWRLREPVDARADDGEIERILYQLESLIRGEVITSGEREERGLSLKDYGLEEPRIRLLLGAGDAYRTLLIGKDAALGEGVYIKEDGREEILVVDNTLLQSIPSDANALRDIVLFPFERAAVKRIGIRRADGYLQLAQSSTGTWSIQQPIVGRANAVEVIRLVDALFTLRIQRFIADGVGDPAAYGLTDPQVQVSLWTGDDEAGRTLMLGGRLEDDDDLIYAKWENADSVYAIARAADELLNLDMAELRERNLLPIPPMGIASVRIAEGEKLLSLIKDSENGWMIAEPRKEKADDRRVQTLVERWGRVRIEDFVDDAGTNLAHYGLEPPAMTVEFSTRINVTAAEAGGASAKGSQSIVHIGSVSDDGRVLVKLASEPSIYAIGEEALDDLSLDPLDFRDRRVLNLRKLDVVSIGQSAGAQEQAVTRKADGTGFVSLPEGAAEVDSGAIDALLETVCNLTAERFVTDTPTSLADYGLEAPRAVITLDLSGDAGISKTLLLGDALDGEVYAVIRGQDVIFTLNKPQESALTNSLFIEAPAEEKSSSEGEKPENKE